jgi:hypothetical protein
MLDQVYVAHVATLLLPLLHAAECAHRRVASLVVRQASPDAGLDLPFEMIKKLVFEIPLNLISPKQRPKSERYGVEQPEQAQACTPFNRMFAHLGYRG